MDMKEFTKGIKEVAREIKKLRLELTKIKNILEKKDDQSLQNSHFEDESITRWKMDMEEKVEKDVKDLVERGVISEEEIKGLTSSVDCKEG